MIGVGDRWCGERFESLREGPESNRIGSALSAGEGPAERAKDPSRKPRDNADEWCGSTPLLRYDSGLVSGWLDLAPML